MIPRVLPNPMVAVLLAAATVAAASGCSQRTAPPPEAGYERGGIPDLRGMRVLLFPAQLVSGGHPDFERELVYALEGAGPTVEWVDPEALRRRARGQEALGLDPDRLPVERFRSAEVERVGDPLFGVLYRMGAIENAELALLPVEVRERAAPTDPEHHVVEIVAALLHPRSGRVLWFGVVEGAPGPRGDLPATVTAVEALARRILR
jgi:hypothetical protein